MCIVVVPALEMDSWYLLESGSSASGRWLRLRMEVNVLA